MDRRRFIIMTGTSLAGTTVVVPGWPASREWIQPHHLAANPFTLGVASGDPTAESICLWTRLAPDPLGDGGMPSLPAEVNWDLSPAQDFSVDVRSGSANAWPEFAHIVKPRIAGLQPGRTYYYRFRFGRHESRTGQFRTAPSRDDDRPVRFAVVSCNRYEDGWFHAFRHVREDNVDFVFHAGDYIYEKASKPDRLRPNGEGECFTLADYRRRYALYRLDPDLQDLHAAAAFVATWDDHEVAGNWAGTADKWGTPDDIFATRRAAAFQAYWEAMPFEVPMPEPGGELHLYRSFRYGANVDLLVLDSRQYRADQACGDTTTALCREAQEPGRTMLGDEQERWLEQELDRADGAWTFIGQGVPPFLMDYDAGGPRVVTMDKWDGYPEAQNAFNQVLARSMTPCITLSGDAHQHLAAQRRHPESGETSGADFVATSVTSGGDGQDKDDAWETLQASNPDLIYNSRRRGYILVEVGSETLDAEFRTLDLITSRSHQLFCSSEASVSRSGQLTIKEMQRLVRQVKT